MKRNYTDIEPRNSSDIIWAIFNYRLKLKRKGGIFSKNRIEMKIKTFIIINRISPEYFVYMYARKEAILKTGLVDIFNDD